MPSNKCPVLLRTSRNVVFASRLVSSFPSISKKEPKNFEEPKSWGAVVNNAEKVVGYPTSFLNLRWLLSDEFVNIGLYFIKNLLGTGHPLLTTARNLIIQKNSLCGGLIVLLISKAHGLNKDFSVTEQDMSVGILHKQRVLAEVVEMLRTSNKLHKSIFHLSDNTNYKQKMFYGNKVALLCGDYLLSNSCKEVSKLRNQELIEIVSICLRDLAENEFIGLRDEQNHPIPSKRKIRDVKSLDFTETDEYVNSENVLGDTIPEWRLRTFLSGGSLLSKFSFCALKVANHSSVMQRNAYMLGKQLAYTWQVHFEILPFLQKDKRRFSLVSAPFLFHLDHDPKIYREIEKGMENVELLNYSYLFDEVLKGPGIEDAMKLRSYHANETLKCINNLPESESRLALEKMVEALT